jgi:hypothetical protein
VKRLTPQTVRVREEVLNVVLADLLDARGLLSIPESIRTSASGKGRKLPDVTIADLWGVRIVIEGRIGKNATVRDSLLRDAKKRVEQGISPICLAVLYPPGLRNVESLTLLRKELARTTLLVRAVTEGSEGEWGEATVDGLADTLRRSYELLVSEDVVVGAVEEIENSLDITSEIIAASPAAAPRLRMILGIPAETEVGADDDEGED